MTESKATRHIKVLGLVLIGIQALICFGILLQRYHAFSLGSQFTTYYQAFTYYGTGHFGSGPTYSGAPFIYLRGEFSFVLLSLFGIISRSPLALLGVYELLVFLCNALIFTFALDHLRKSSKTEDARLRLESVMLVVVLFNPFVYLLAVKDVDFGWILALLFGLILLRGRSRIRLWLRVIAIVGALATGVTGAIVLVIVGVARITSFKATRAIEGAIEALLGIGWLITLSITGFDRGLAFSHFIATYSPASLGVGTLGVLPAFAHLISSPTALSKLLSDASTQLAYVIASGGLLGVFSFLGILGSVPLILLSVAFGESNVLQVAALGYVASTITLAGTIRAMQSLSRLGTFVQSAAALIVVLSIIAVSMFITAPYVLRNSWPVNKIDAQAMQHVIGQVAPSAEVIGDSRLLARLGARDYLYSDVATRSIPVQSKLVYFVFTKSASKSANDVAPDSKYQLVRNLGARLIYSSGTISLYDWYPHGEVAVSF